MKILFQYTSPYIDNYFLEGEVLHGTQKLWYSGNRLAKESEYDTGVLIYEKEYDVDGRPDFFNSYVGQLKN